MQILGKKLKCVSRHVQPLDEYSGIKNASTESLVPLPKLGEKIKPPR